ncbi:MAG: hypothetical protein HYZ74_04480 [Elusimicrobia bacterium]|nr:hypothetical protein [Elusimicrobiota bacterium]
MPGSKPNTPGTINTSVEELLLKRADQAAEFNEVVNFGGVDCYAVYQGGGPGGVAFLPKDLVDGRATVNPNKLRPVLYGETAVRNADGISVSIDGKPHLGKFGGKEYHLENSGEGWEIKDGPGDAPKAKAKPESGGGAGAGAGAGGAAGAGAAGGGHRGSSGEDMPMDALVEVWSKTQNCKPVNPDDIKELDENLKGKYSVISCKDKEDGTGMIMVFVPKSEAEEQALRYRDLPDMPLVRGRYVKHYLIVEFEKQKQYFDLLKHDEKDGKDTGFKMVGFVNIDAANKVTMNKFLDVDALADALKRFTALGEADKAAPVEIPKRVGTMNESYSLHGSFLESGGLNVALSMGGKVRQVWPNDTGFGAAGAPGKYGSLKGPGNVLEDVSSVDEKFPEKPVIDVSHKAELVEKTEDIALYQSQNIPGQAAEPRKYYLMYKFKEGEGKKAAVYRSKLIPVFGDAGVDELPPLPDKAKRGMAGLVIAGQAALSRAGVGHGFVAGSSEAKGVLAVYQQKQVTGENVANKKANCVGPIFWWGVGDRAAAEKICKADKF